MLLNKKKPDHLQFQIFLYNISNFQAINCLIILNK